MSREGLTARLSVLPLRFEANRGQTTPRVRYLVRGPGYTLFLTHAAAVLSLLQHQRWTTAGRPDASIPHGRAAVLRLGLLGANLHARIVGQGRQAGTTTYLRGHGVVVSAPTYARVRYQHVYPGIDLVYHGHAGTLEYDWLLTPGADARAIRLAVGGAVGLRVDGHGALLIRTPLGTLRQERPVAYQIVRGYRVAVAVRYVHPRRGVIGLRPGRYDQHLALTIDPVLQYSSYLGGSAADAVTAVAVDGRGNTYLTGYTASADFTATVLRPRITTYDAFVTELNSTGAVSYSVYLGGKGSDAGWGIAVDGNGDAFVTGQTTSPDFPNTGGASVLTLPLTTTAVATTTNAFVTKLGPTGAISYSTLLGSTANVLTQGSLSIPGLGDSGGRAIAVDGSGNAYLTGQTDSPSFPVTLLDPRSITATVTLSTSMPHGTCTLSGGTGSLCYDAFVTKLGPTGSISYSTYLGGGRDDYGYGLALDGENTGLVYVTGRTESSDFPISGTLQSFNKGANAVCHETTCPDAFVAKLDTTMSFTAVGALGGGGLLSDLGTLVGGNVSNLLHPSLLWSTYLGGSGADEGTGIALDPGGAVYVTGDTAPLTSTASADFPTTTGAYSTTATAGTCPVGPCADVFVAKLPNNGSSLSYASRFGGSGDDKGASIAVDTAGHAYVTGSTTSAGFPTLGSLQGFSAVTTGGSPATMAFVTKLNGGGQRAVVQHVAGRERRGRGRGHRRGRRGRRERGRADRLDGLPERAPGSAARAAGTAGANGWSGSTSGSRRI